MELLATSIHGVRIVRSEAKQRDDRGFFLRVYDAQELAAAGIDHAGLVQENQSRSVRRTIRGLHTRSHLSEAKIVRCARGEIFDVVVDVRPWSPTFLHWESFILSDENFDQIAVPPGVAHGFQALSDIADVCYRVDSYYEPRLDVAISYCDPNIGIPWPLRDPIVSPRDAVAPTLAQVRPLLTSWYGDRDPQELVPGVAPVLVLDVEAESGVR